MRHKKSYCDIMPKPVIDYKKCSVCETCIEVCPVKVFSKQGKKVIVKSPDECIGCMACESSCEQSAIKILD